tara:strand:+ start:2140 stop:3180 length:1041 start_codon:yes stop_codon:yes gene_type:complete
LKKYKVLVINRLSLVDPAQLGRSIVIRLTEPLEYLNKKGLLDFEVLNPGEITSEILKNKKFDLAFINKSCDKSTLEVAKLINALQIKIIYDLDDNIFEFPNYSYGSSKHNDIVLEILRISSIIITSNIPLERLIWKHLKKRTVIIEHGINLEKYASKTGRKESKHPKIVFTNADNLKFNNFKGEFLLALNKIQVEFPDLEINVYSDKKRILGDKIKYTDLGNRSYSDHKLELAKSDYWFAIVPLAACEEPELNSFHNCKSPIKYLDYGMSSIPTIFSDAYIYQGVIKHLETGILTRNNHSSWLYWLRRLILDRELRYKLAKNSYLDIKENHNIQRMSDKILDVIYN